MRIAVSEENVLGPRLRVVLGLAGALCGVSAWLLFDVYAQGQLAPRLHLFLALFFGVFFGAFLISVGPLRLARAALSSLALAAVVASLVWWASFRFADPRDLFASTETLLAVVLLSTLPLPFLIAAGLPGAGWHDYPALFTQSWSIVVRYASAWLFVAVVWAVLFLSDQLFLLVGITLLSHLISTDWLAYVLTGLSLGIGLSVVDELSDYVSPFLILRLLRVIMPVVTLVVAVFLAALPFQGLSNLFGQISVAGTLLAMAVAAATLVTAALDRDDDEAVRSKPMQFSIQLLALMLPALALLGGWAIWLRVAEHGLTPPRIGGLTGAGLLLLYGLSYAVSVLRRGRWGARIRRDNRVLALVVIAVAGLWLTPLFNADAITAANRVARYQRAATPPGAVDLYYLKTRLGHAGTEALATLRAIAARPEQKALAERFADLDAGRLGPGAKVPADIADLRARLTRDLAVRPKGEGANLKAQILSTRSVWQLKLWAEACTRTLPSGQPGCVLLVGDFLPDSPGQEALLLTRDNAGRLRIDGFAHRSEGGALMRVNGARQLLPGAKAPSSVAVIEAVLAGKTSLSPARVQALDIGGLQLMVQP
ncbi:hypothetical protein U879_00525 [Defluviimonas sp. 20V17]|uniref:DUF4153 domain-containing protein n=1 Tax=Allgaiera indica TaxID=765699 RepID=A0A1H3BFN4_9RHOB|nr:DUF4153 domain-containing protein [Allgaiera indica]KDB05610.1 hypothetical protein U879_00525 [Defluviimonas sp. 20V17]SDX40174.1 protein of unknown function [Allgaiera indica]